MLVDEKVYKVSPACPGAAAAVLPHCAEFA